MISSKNDIEEGCCINNENIDKEPTLNINEFKNKENYKKENNTASFIIKKLSNSLIDENNNNSYNAFQKQNESNELFFQDIKNIKKNEATSFTILNILKNKKAISVLNKKFNNIFNKNISYSSLHNKNYNDFKTQRNIRNNKFQNNI